MTKPKKSAKDMAFERERMRLLKVIREKDDEILRLTRELNQAKSSAESWENTAHILESKLGIPKEEILASIEREKKLENMLTNPFATVLNGFL